MWHMFYTHAHAHARTRTHTHARARMHTREQARARVSACATHTHARTHTLTHSESPDDGGILIDQHGSHHDGSGLVLRTYEEEREHAEHEVLCSFIHCKKKKCEFLSLHFLCFLCCAHTHMNTQARAHKCPHTHTHTHTHTTHTHTHTHRHERPTRFRGPVIRSLQ